MTTALFTHPDCARHLTPPGHPERAARLDAVLSALDGMDLLRRTAPPAAEEHLLRVHPRRHLDALRRAAPGSGWRSLDADTHMSPGTLGAALRAAGAAVAAVDCVLAGEAGTAFCAVRPPGHHAEQETAMGFCFFGNVAAAAKHALDHHGLSRVAIVDFDVHHGNGTEALVKDDPRILFASTHGWPLWPGSGHPSETGPHGTIVNVPLREGTGGAGFRAAMADKVLPRVAAHRPDLILISAGFDAHRADPLGNLALEVEDFAWVTREIRALARDHAQGRVVSVLEGGYDLAALAAAAAAHVQALGERA